MSGTGEWEASAAEADGEVPGIDSAEVRRVDLDGPRVRYLVAGDGPPVVLVHGGGMDSAAVSWRETIPALAPDHTVYAPDLPGYGGSDDPEGTPTPDYYADVLARFLDALGLAAVDLGGVSLGGAVSLGLALERPGRVRRLVLVDSYGLGGRVPGGAVVAALTQAPYLLEATWALLARSRRLTWLVLRGTVHPANLGPALVDEVYDLIRSRRTRSFVDFQRAEVRAGGLRTNYVDRLPDLAVPTLLVHGEDDRFVPAAWAVRAGTLIPDAEVRVLPTCGHWAPRERPGRVNELLRGFLD